MNIFTVLREQDQFVIQEMKSFLQDYRRIDDNQRMERVAKAFNTYRAHMILEERHIYSAIRSLNNFEPKIQKALEHHQDIEDMISHILNLHVDEPHFEFRDQMQKLLKLIEDHSQFEEEELFPYVRQECLSPYHSDVFNAINQQVMEDELIPTRTG